MERVPPSSRRATPPLCQPAYIYGLHHGSSGRKGFKCRMSLVDCNKVSRCVDMVPLHGGRWPPAHRAALRISLQRMSIASKPRQIAGGADVLPCRIPAHTTQPEAVPIATGQRGALSNKAGARWPPPRPCLPRRAPCAGRRRPARSRPGGRRPPITAILETATPSGLCTTRTPRQSLTISHTHCRAPT